MNLERIEKQLRREAETITRAADVLGDLRKPVRSVGRQLHHHLTATQRHRISVRMRKSWAERRRLQVVRKAA